MIGVSRKAGMRLIVFLLTITLGVFALAQADAQSDSSASLHRSTTVLVSPGTASAGTYFDHVIIILMENQESLIFAERAHRHARLVGPHRTWRA